MPTQVSGSDVYNNLLVGLNTLYTGFLKFPLLLKIFYFLVPSCARIIILNNGFGRIADCLMLYMPPVQVYFWEIVI